MTSQQGQFWECTCGIWSGSADSDRCPKCGADRLINRGALDFAAAPWEEVDIAGRRYGVFSADGCSPDPIAIFRTERACDDWITWHRCRGSDSDLPLDICVMPIEHLSGIAWNEISPPPDPGAPWPILFSTPVDPPTDPTSEIVAASIASSAAKVAVASFAVLPFVGCIPLIMASVALLIMGLDASSAFCFVAVPAYVLCSLVAIWIIRREYCRVIS